MLMTPPAGVGQSTPSAAGAGAGTTPRMADDDEEGAKEAARGAAARR